MLSQGCEADVGAFPLPGHLGESVGLHGAPSVFHPKMQHYLSSPTTASTCALGGNGPTLTISQTELQLDHFPTVSSLASYFPSLVSISSNGWGKQCQSHLTLIFPRLL